VKVLKRIVLGVLAVVLLVLAAFYFLLRASLPPVEGERTLAGLTAAVSIERDALGIPTITAATRTDLAFGTGFAHAQDRFFQMDLSRRLAGGELSELFGAVAIEHDRRARKFLFRLVARESLRQGTGEQRAILEAYAHGVNAGLASLRSRPWEYWVLQVSPRSWVAEDTVMVTFAMWWDLQFPSLRSELARREIQARLGAAMPFFYPRGTSWDAANAESLPGPPPLRIPTPSELDIRTTPAGDPSAAGEREPAAGSNGWAIAGEFTSTGAALVASDMHLGLRVPTVWYRARLRLDSLDLNGLTLPGAPVLVAGSNGRVAWGFTNSYGDWLDTDIVPCATIPLEARRGVIKVKGGENVTYVVEQGPAGLLYEADAAKERCVFVRWLATVPAATNLEILSLERVGSTEEALELAPRIGIPHQNFMVGDRDGHIGWSVIGRIPADAARPTLAEVDPAAAEDRITWTTAFENHPYMLDTPAGFLWTANARPLDEEPQESTIGGDEAPFGADFDLGARASQIRDDLIPLLSRATPADMLRVQIDDRALFLARWRELALATLDDAATRAAPRRAELRKLIAGEMTRASADSVSYRLVRGFRNTTERAAWGMIVAALGVEPAATRVPPQFEGPLWQLVTQQPLHLLAAKYPDWRAFLLAQLDEVAESCPELPRCTWGGHQPVAIRHPLSAALPFGPRFLDMPTLELPGDHDMPRVQDGAFGASNRFAVSPGHEAEGYLTIAGGQSGHPLSPYYRAGFAAWAEGRPLPFLPGPAAHRLQLAPE